jgi:hypothetical protein
MQILSRDSRIEQQLADDVAGRENLQHDVARARSGDDHPAPLPLRAGLHTELNSIRVAAQLKVAVSVAAASRHRKLAPEGALRAEAEWVVRSLDHQLNVRAIHRGPVSIDDPAGNEHR